MGVSRFFYQLCLLIPKQRGVLSFPETINTINNQVIKCIENADCERGCSQWYRERGRLNS